MNLRQEDESAVANRKETAQAEMLNLERIEQHLNMLDQRLDNMDSVITALVERVMKHPLMVEMKCPNCGQVIQVGIVGSERPG